LRDENGLIQGISTRPFLFANINQTQKHELRISKLEDENKELRSENKEIRAKLEKLESMIV
jgi:cell division protein FtsB